MLVNKFFTKTSTALGANATFISSSTDVGNAIGFNQSYTQFNMLVVANQAGTARIDVHDGVNWVPSATGAVVANVPLILSVPANGRTFRAVVVNGGVAQTSHFVLVSISD